MSQFLATGCGRSGTAWVSQFFTHLGFYTGHEEQFNPHRHGPLQHNEVSWLAVPYIHKIDPDTKVLRVIRNPYDVVYSGMQMQFQKQKRRTHYDEFLAHHRPDIVEPGDKLGRMIRWACTWDKGLNDVDHMVIAPDKDSPKRLQEVVKYATGEHVSLYDIVQVRNELGSKVNTKPRRVKLDFSAMRRHKEAWRLKRRARKFGYDHR